MRICRVALGAELDPVRNTIRARETQMADNNRFRGWWCAVASAALLAAAAIAPTASAQETRLQGSIGPAKTVDLATAAELPAVPRPAGLAINRPTIPMADYLAAKNAAAMAKTGASRPQTGAAPPASSTVTLYAQVGSTNETQTTGGTVFPPDGDIATSSQWMVQVNNDVVTMLNWFTNAFVQTKLNTFFADSTSFIFNPRVIYDPYWDRFVVLADGCVNCGNTTSNLSAFKLAVSRTGDPTGAWLNYAFPVTAVGDFADFPQLGMDMKSLILTYNDFKANGTFDARTFSLAKALLYSGRGAAGGFTQFGCTVAPPYVLDNNGVDYIMAFCPGDNKVYIGSLRDTGLTTASINLWDNTVNLDYYGLPPNAPQPGVNYPLDTGDNRFENRSLQVGSRLLNAATIGNSGPATASWYNFDIGVSPHILAGNSLWYANGNTSSDWHPAINANTVGAPAGTPLGEIFGTWMSVDATNNVNVQLRAIGGLGDTIGTLSGIAVFTSSIPLTNQTDGAGIHRSGDYSYIATYPAAALGCSNPGELGILEGETSGPAAGTWGTRVAIVKHC
jgi:hypothetical protein